MVAKFSIKKKALECGAVSMLLAISTFIGPSGAFSAPAANDGQLKSAVPSLDTFDSLQVPGVIKGGVEHRQNAVVKRKKTVKKKPLAASTDKADSRLGLLQGKSDAQKGLREKASVQESPPSYQFKIDRTIGIIGVKFLKIPGQAPVINRVFQGTPAWQAGLSINDHIVAVDGVPTSGLSKEQCYDLIVGTPNTPVTISILRHGAFGAKNMSRMDFNEIPDANVRRDYLMSL